MTYFDTAHEYLTGEREAGNYSDAMHIDVDAAAAYAALRGLDALRWVEWIDEADSAYRGTWEDVKVRPAGDPASAIYSVNNGHAFRVA